MEQNDDDSSITEVSSCDTWELISSPYTLRQIRQEIKGELVQTINDDILPQLLQKYVKDLNFSDNDIKTSIIIEKAFDKKVTNRIHSLKNEIIRDVLEIVKHEIVPEILEKVNRDIVTFVTKKLAASFKPTESPESTQSSINHLSEYKSACNQIMKDIKPHINHLTILFCFHEKLITNFDLTSQSIPIVLKSFHPFCGKFSPIVNLIRNVLINCWSNNWTGSLVITSDSKNSSEIICKFLKRIRGLFDNYTLGITIVEIKGCEFKDQKTCKKYTDDYDYSVYNDLRINERISLDHSKITCTSKSQDATITFQDGDLFGKYAEFSNHHITAIKIKDEIWPTPVHYIEAQKYTSHSIQKQIRMTSNIKKALAFSQNYSSQQRKDWDSFILPSGHNFVTANETPKLEAFRIAITNKFEQHPHLKYKLLSTGSLSIKHQAKDADGNILDLVDKNLLGKVLEDVRNLFMEIECKKAANEFVDGDEKLFLEEVRGKIWEFKNI
ncbi:5944_t:CDS:2 [Dentiscutata heterogama]|uniref:5944_t:CDS:1 n=1 Tax=Dentiscutata heterogama TaxID=1316150 RepID=A0ACA9K7L7_9GLOM|nr:5944_t:CDS:2 [Dentiscutata heterogama]